MARAVSTFMAMSASIQRRPWFSPIARPNWRRPAAIIPRREAERDLFRHGRYPGGTIPVWSVDRKGRVDFSRPIRRLTEDEALAGECVEEGER